MTRLLILKPTDFGQSDDFGLSIQNVARSVASFGHKHNAIAVRLARNIVESSAP